MNFTKASNVVMSNLYLANFVPQADLFILCCECRTELIITRIIFHQIVLCLNTSKINHPGSDFRRLNQHWLLSCTELNAFLPRADGLSAALTAGLALPTDCHSDIRNHRVSRWHPPTGWGPRWTKRGKEEQARDCGYFFLPSPSHFLDTMILPFPATMDKALKQRAPRRVFS